MWDAIFQASVHELLQLGTLKFAGLNSEQRQYVKVLLAYHDGRAAELRALDKKYRWTDEILKATVRLRSGVRSQSLSLEEIAALQKKISRRQIPTNFLGEFYFVAAFATESLGAYRWAVKRYQKAAVFLNQAGLLKKGLKASFNILACQSRLAPEPHYLSDLHFVIRQAQQLGEVDVEAMARNNLSRELQRRGSWDYALDEIKKARELLCDQYRSFNYAQVLLQELDLYAEKNWQSRARTLRQELETYTFPEVLEALKVLRNKYAGQMQKLNAEKLSYQWKERLEANKWQTLTPLETRCLNLLAQGPQDKEALMESLYGDRLSYSSREGRVKILLNRLRKKFPREIAFYRGQYLLQDQRLL